MRNYAPWESTTSLFYLLMYFCNPIPQGYIFLLLYLRGTHYVNIWLGFVKKYDYFCNTVYGTISLLVKQKISFKVCNTAEIIPRFAKTFISITVYFVVLRIIIQLIWRKNRAFLVIMYVCPNVKPLKKCGLEVNYLITLRNYFSCIFRVYVHVP